MLTTAIAVSESAYHIYLVTANQVARHILQELGILEDLDNRIYVNSSIYNPSKSADQNKNAILVEDKFVCNFDMKHPVTGLTYDTADIGIHMDAVRHRRDWLTRNPILMDSQHGIVLYDSMIPYDITLNCELYFRDYIKAHDIADRFLLRFNRGELMSVANLSYNFPLPFQILQTLWALASTAGVHKDCFPHWLEEYSNGIIKRLVSTSANNKRYEWVVERTLFESLVKIEYDFSEPEKTGVDNAETHTLRFTCTLHSSRPSVLYVDYPIIINNTLVPGEIVHVDTSYQKNLYEFLEHENRFLDPVYQYEKYLVYQPVRNPWYDTWDPPKGRTQYDIYNSIPIFIGLFTLDEPECKECPCDGDITPYEDQCEACKNCTCYCLKKATTVLDISKDLDMYALRPRILNYFKERKEAALLISSVYNIAVFRDDVQIDPKLLEFDGTILKVPNRLGRDHEYRLVIGYTPYRKVDYSMAWQQGYDPENPNRVEIYGHPWFYLLDCIIIPKHERATTNANVQK